MKIIRTIADLERLKEMGSIPPEYISVVECDFMDWFEAEGTGESLMMFEMPNHACIYHLEDKNDASFLLNQLINIEFVEKDKIKDCSYFRIGVMNDNVMNLVYFLEGTLDQKFEEWLQR